MGRTFRHVFSLQHGLTCTSSWHLLGLLQSVTPSQLPSGVKFPDKVQAQGVRMSLLTTAFKHRGACHQPKITQHSRRHGLTLGLGPPLPNPASWLSTKACAMLQSNTRRDQDPQGLEKPGARCRLVARKAGTEVTGAKISAALWVLGLPGSTAGTSHKMTWGPLGARKAMPSPHLCLYPRAGVSSAEVAASA